MKKVNVFLLKSKVEEKHNDKQGEYKIVKNHRLSGVVDLNKEIKGLLLDESISLCLDTCFNRIIEEELSLQSIMSEIYKICSDYVARYGAEIEKIELQHERSTDVGSIKGGYIKVDSVKFEPKANEHTL